VVKDANNPERRLFLPIKNNLGDDRNGLAYTIRNGEHVDWEENPVNITADEAMSRCSVTDDERSDRDSAAGFLRQALADGPMAASTLIEQAAQNGFSQKAIRRAADKLGVRREKSSFGGPWKWELPEQDAQHSQDAAPWIREPWETLGILATQIASGVRHENPAIRISKPRKAFANHLQNGLLGSRAAKAAFE
jgi:hypothetical protein